MPDRLFSDAEQAALYDRPNPPEQRSDFGFYLPMVMAAASVLDIGCGTGTLLHMARDAGHSGRLVGLDCWTWHGRRTEWIAGDLSTVAFDREFELAVMTGHAFQVLLADGEDRAALASVRAALTDDGRFAFETRNPSARGRFGRRVGDHVS